MDEARQMQLHDLAAVRRCCDDALLYLDRLLASTPPLPGREARQLRGQRERIGQAVVAVDRVAQRLRDASPAT